MKICVVTPEISFQMPNSGVATNSTHLARFLGKVAGDDTVLLSGTPGNERAEELKRQIRDFCGAELVCLDELPDFPGLEKLTPNQLRISYRMSRWLVQRNFDAIFFMQYQCCGFIPIQMKRLGTGFQRTRMILVMNGPREWVAKNNLEPAISKPEHMVIDHMERYCAAHADTVLSPSNALLQWVGDEAWSLSADTRRLPTWTPWQPLAEEVKTDPLHLVFVGRLEARKGLDIFCEALSLLAANADERGRMLRIDIVGKSSRIGGLSSENFIRNWAGNLPAGFKVTMHTTFGQAETAAFLDANRSALFVYPSRMDNFPNAVNEAKARGCAVLVSDSSGCEELIGNRLAFFKATPQDLARKLSEVWKTGVPPSPLLVSMPEAERMRLDFLDEIRSAPPRSHTHLEVVRPHRKISVCIPYYNLGPYLDEALASIKKQTYPDFEVIVVNDGSTDPDSVAAFADARRKFASKRWHFMESENSGVCAARNLAASHATGELLLFFDADNVAYPHMLETLEERLQTGRIDAITCYLHAFKNGESSAMEDIRLHFGFPGGCLEAAFYYNTLGDTNLLVRRGAFEAVGGFHLTKVYGSEDRAFLIRLLRKGFELDCTPERLFAYRLREDSLSQTHSDYHRRHAVLDAFTEDMPYWIARLLTQIFEAHHEKRTKVDSKHHGHPDNKKLLELRSKLLEERKKRRERDAKADERYESLLKWRNSPYVRLGRFLRIIERDF